MKYTCSIEINAALETVVQLWSNEENFIHWQDGFVKIVHIEGNPNQVGSKSKIYLKQGKREMELTETIFTNNLPEEKIALYEHSHMSNTQATRFKSLGENKTQYISEVEYTQFNGIVPKMMAKLFPSMFRKQSEKWMRQFKEFVEK